MNPVLGMLPRFAGVFKSIGRAARIVSPLAREVGNVSSNFVPEKDEKQSKLRQLASSVGSFAVTQSPLLSESMDALGTLGYIFGKKGGGDSTKTTSEDRNALSGPGGAETKAKTDPRGQNNVVLEYLTDGNNQYMKAFGSLNERLNTISATLRQQLEFTQKLVGINQKILKANEELRESNRAKSAFDTVERKNSARERARNQPRDEFGRFMSPNTENVEPPDESEGGGLFDKLSKGAGGAAAFGFLRKGMRAVSGGIGRAFRATGGLLRSAGGRISSLFTRGTSAAATRAATTAVVQQTARAGATTAARRSIPRMLAGLLPRLAGPAGVAAAILEPSELGVDPQEEFRSRIFEKLGNEGVSALPEIREMLNSEQGQFVRENFPSPEYDTLLNDDEKAREYARSIFNSGFSTGRKQSSELFYGDTNAAINRMIQDYTRDGDGFQMSPDTVRMKIANSPAAMRTQSSLDMINSAAPVTAGTSGGPAGAPPMIVNNQGGPTSVNNGGNVTNIIMGGSSLDLPQVAYNLASTAH